MCTISEKGYKFKITGRTMKNFKLEDLSEEEVLELYKTPANAVDLYKLRTNLHDIRDEIQRTNNTISLALEEMQKHTHNCPIAKPAVNSMIDVKIAEFNGSEKMASGVKKIINLTILSTGKLIGAIVTIFSALVIFGLIAHSIGQ